MFLRLGLPLSKVKVFRPFAAPLDWPVSTKPSSSSSSSRWSIWWTESCPTTSSSGWLELSPRSLCLASSEWLERRIVQCCQHQTRYFTMAEKLTRIWHSGPHRGYDSQASRGKGEVLSCQTRTFYPAGCRCIWRQNFGQVRKK